MNIIVTVGRLRNDISSTSMQIERNAASFAERYVDYDDEIFDILTEIKRNGDCMTWFPANIAYLVFTLPFDLVYNTIEWASSFNYNNNHNNCRCYSYLKLYAKQKRTNKCQNWQADTNSWAKMTMISGIPLA